MHSVFAIEPEAINTWNDFRYLMEKFGYSHGILIAHYLNKWPRLVIQACKANGVPDVALSSIVDRLQRAKADRLCKLGLDYDSDVPWLDNALSKAESNDLDGVFVREADSSNGKLYSVADVDDSLFAGRRDVTVIREARALASAAEALIRGARSIVLIDPYFRPKKPYLKVLQSLLDVVGSLGKQSCEIVVHTAHSKYPAPAAEYISESEQWLTKYKGRDMSVQVIRWSDKSLDFDLHARYLLSEYGGLRYDRGFEEPQDHDKRAMRTDVVCMDQQRKHEVEEQFSGFEINENVHDIMELLSVD